MICHHGLFTAVVDQGGETRDIAVRSVDAEDIDLLVPSDTTRTIGTHPSASSCESPLPSIRSATYPLVDVFNAADLNPDAGQLDHQLQEARILVLHGPGGDLEGRSLEVDINFERFGIDDAEPFDGGRYRGPGPPPVRRRSRRRRSQRLRS
jgi:hypothetical protein